MEENKGIILYGCKLAKDLEANLPNWLNQPDIILSKTEEIILVFNSIRERLSQHHHHRPSPPPLQQQLSVGGGGGVGGVQEWLSTSVASSIQALGLFHAAELLGGDRAAAGAAFAVHGEGSVRLQEVVGQPMDVSDSSRPGGSSSSSGSLQRQRRRKDDTDRRTVRVAAPRMGNLEIPPEDCYTWRKYGQKEILGSRFPRAYYRCTHQKLYNCPAKKQVQRLDNDPYVFEVTYRSQHTCHISGTAPTSSAPPPPFEDVTHQTSTTVVPPPPPRGNWLSMDIKGPQGEGTSAATPFDHRLQMYRDFGHGTSGSLASSANAVVGGGSVGPSGVRFVDYQPVVDLADAMFNSGSSSNNSMDIIFSSMDDKWDSAAKKE